MGNHFLLKKIRSNEDLAKRFVSHCYFYLKTILRKQELYDKAVKVCKQFEVEFQSQEERKKLFDTGWCIVEANRRGQFIWQIPSQSGFREEINGIMDKLDLKY